MLETAPPPVIDGSVGSLGASVAVSFLSLGLVCVLAFLALRWLSRRPPGPSHGPLRVLARQSLDPKRAVFIIEAAERCFLVGSGEGAMALLAELDREVIARELAPKRPVRRSGSFWSDLVFKRSTTAGSFGDVLARALGRKSPPPAAMMSVALDATPAPAPGEPSKPKPSPTSTPSSEPTVPEGGLA